ncbi:MAG: glycosyltransferase, partial [Flavobacteriales bacterium]|nr:glycosyltransferase [Flavobacteriales bacterium]
MKVLFLTHWFPTEDTPQKGVFIREQAKALVKVGAEITVLQLNINDGPRLLKISQKRKEVDGFETIRVNITGKLWKLVYTIYPIQLRLIKKQIAKLGLNISQFDLIHSHVVHPSAAIGNRLAEESNLPHFISEHWSNLEYYFTKNLYRGWGKDAYDRAKRIFVVSEFLKEQTKRFVSDTSKLAVIPNVVPAEEFRYRPAPIGTSYYLVMAAKWNKSKRLIKRPKLLIKA